MSDEPDFSTHVLAIVGVGLLGGSVAQAAKKRGLAEHVVGIGRNAERLRAAVDLGIIDSFATDPSSSDPIWDFVVVGTPVDRIPDDVRRMANASRSGTLITDVGSVKRPICEALSGELPTGVEFVGSHPLAGSERKGFEFSDSELFDGRVTVVTPCSSTDKNSWARVVAFWESLGSQVEHMTPEAHDAALATTSHLPHVAASALAAILPESERRLAATGFRDTTRVAAGDPDLWVSILLGNASAVEASLDRFGESFERFREAIRNRDSSELKKLLEVAKTSRDSL